MVSLGEAVQVEPDDERGVPFVQLHGAAAGLPVVRPTNDVDVQLLVETGRGRAAQVARALEELRYELRPSLDARTGTAHRFVREGAVVDLVTSEAEPSVVDMVAADHAPPRALEGFRGYDLVQVEGGTQALRRTVMAEMQISGMVPTTLSVPDAFGALVLKAAAHRTDTRDRDRHLADAAVLLACVDPFEDREASGSDHSRLLYLQRQLADRTATAWLQLPRTHAATGRPRSTSCAPDPYGAAVREPLSEDDVERLETSARTPKAHRQAAATLTRWAETRHPDDEASSADLLAAAGWHLAQAGDTEASLVLHRRAVVAEGTTTPSARALLHAALLEAGHLDEARQVATDLRRSGPRIVDIAHTAETFELHGDLVQAHRWVEMGVSRLELAVDDDEPAAHDVETLLNARRRIRAELGYPPDELDG